MVSISGEILVKSVYVPQLEENTYPLSRLLDQSVKSRINSPLVLKCIGLSHQLHEFRNRHREPLLERVDVEINGLLWLSFAPCWEVKYLHPHTLVKP